MNSASVAIARAEEAPSPPISWIWRVLGYFGALGVAAVSIWICLLLDPWVRDHFIPLIFLLGIAICGWLFGFGPSLATAFICSLFVASFFLSATSVITDPTAARVALAAYSIAGLGVCMIVSRERRIRLRLRNALAAVTRIERLAQKAEEEARAAQLETERASTAKEEFLSLVSHDLRNPINAIVLSAGTLRHGTFSPERLARGLDRIERAALTLTRMVDELVDSTRITRGNLVVQLDPLDLVAVLRSSIEAMRPAANEKRIDMVDHISREAVTVLGDGARLTRAFTNIIDNAIKFTPAEGRIEIVMTLTGGSVRVAVSDTGQGISSDFLPRVFERFEQGAPSASEHHGGLGLGLWIVKNLIERHGGTVSAQSEGLGRGSTFVITLPIAPAAVPKDRA